MDESETGSTHLRWMGPTLGDDFPDLRGETQTTNNFSLYQYFGKSWGIVFMHPADFTPVCTTEIGAAQSLIDEFEVRNVKICGFSCDDSKRHRAWLADIEAATGQRITFPLFCDPSRMAAIELGVFDPKLKDVDGLPLTVRSVFIINPQRKIALTMTYPSSVGRSFDEILRVVDALQRADQFKVATPANWSPGDKTLISPDLDDDEAARRFGKNGYSTVDLPSERGKQLKKHYLRYTDDPVFTSNNKQSFRLAMRITKPKVSWRPPKSFALSYYLPTRKKRDQPAADETYPDATRRNTNTTNDLTIDLSNKTECHEPVSSPEVQAKGSSPETKESDRPSVDYSNHRPWKVLLRPFSNLRLETVETSPGMNSIGRRKPSSVHSHENTGSELLVGFGEKEKDGDGPVVW